MTISISKGLGKRFQHSSVLVALLLLAMLVVPIPGWAAVSVDTGGYSGSVGCNFIKGLVEQPDGKLLVAESCIGGYSKVSRLNNDGTVDPSFSFEIGQFGGAYDLIQDMILLIDGRILVSMATYYSPSDPQSDDPYYIIRLSNDGSVEFRFDLSLNDRVNTMIEQPDGQILIGGNFTIVDGEAHNNTALINADGSLDTSFQSDIPSNLYSFIAMALQRDGKVLISASFTDVDGGTGTHGDIIRLNPDGSLDSNFHSEASNIFSSVLVLQPDGKILTEDGRLNPDGSLDASFNFEHPEYEDDHFDFSSMVLQPDGKILAGGMIVGPDAAYIGRYNVDGSYDISFKYYIGPHMRSYIDALLLQSDGKVVYDLHNPNPSGHYLQRLYSDGSPDSGFSDTGANDWIQTLVIQPDNKLLVGGFFTDIDGVPRNRVARLQQNGSLDTSFDPGAGANDWISSIALQPDGKVLIGGNFTEFDGVTRNYIARLNLDGSLDIGFITNPSVVNDNVRAITQQPDGKILVGGFFGLVRLNPGGSKDVDFNLGSGVNGTVYGIVQQLDGKILIAGDFTAIDGVSRNRIARLNPNGSVDTSFNPGSGANGPIYSLAIQPDGKVLIGGNFTNINGTSHKFISRLDANGSVDTSFNPGTNLNDLVLSMALQADGKIVIGGYFTEYGGISHNRIARLNPDGSLDTHFDLGSGANSSVETMALQGDGSIVIGGHFTEVDGIEQNYISRLIQDEAALQQLSAAVDGEAVTWLRDGVGPVLERVTFEVSDSLYGGWTMLGSGYHTAGGWSLDGLNFPVGQKIYIRARGYYGTNASSMTESILQFYLEKPSILVSVTAKPSVLKEPGGSVTFNIAINNTSATNTVTIDTLTDIFYGNLNGEGNCSVPRAITAGNRYKCAFEADISGSAGVSETDKVTASGTDEYGNPVSDNDSATVKIIKDGGCFYYTPKNKSPLMICW